MRRQIVQNVFWLLLERGFQVIASIATIAMIARTIGPEGFAHFQYAQALILIASSVALVCGSEVLVPRLVATTSEQAKHTLIAHAFCVREGAAILAYCLMLAAVTLSGQDAITRDICVVLGLSIFLREPFGVVNGWMQARTNNRAGVFFSLSALCVKVGVVGLLFVWHISVVRDFAWAFAAESLVLASLLAWHYLRHASTLRVKFDFSLAIQLLRDGVIFWIGLMLMMSARRIDQILLKPQVPLAELGAYAACMQIVDNFVLLATIIANTLAPLAIFAQPTFDRVRRNLIRVAIGMAAVGTAGGVTIAAFAPWIVHLLYGSKFAIAATLLERAALASGLVFMDAALSLLIIYLRKPSWLAIKWAIVIVTIASVDWVAIPKYGAAGAVTGYIVGYSLSVVFGLVLYFRSRDPALVTAPA